MLALLIIFDVIGMLRFLSIINLFGEYFCNPSILQFNVELSFKIVSEVVKNSQSGIIALKTNNLEGYDVRIFTINESGVEQTVILEGVNGAAGGLDLSVDNTKLLYTRDVSGFESADYRRLNSRMFMYDFVNSTSVDLSEDKDGLNV